MTPARLATILALLRWSQRDLGVLEGRDHRMIGHWLSGRYPVPAVVAEWLEALAAAHKANPLPPRSIGRKT